MYKYLMSLALLLSFSAEATTSSFIVEDTSERERKERLQHYCNTVNYLLDTKFIEQPSKNETDFRPSEKVADYLIMSVVSLKAAKSKLKIELSGISFEEIYKRESLNPDVLSEIIGTNNQPFAEYQQAWMDKKVGFSYANRDNYSQLLDITLDVFNLKTGVPLNMGKEMNEQRHPVYTMLAQIAEEDNIPVKCFMTIQEEDYFEWLKEKTKSHDAPAIKEEPKTVISSIFSLFRKK